MLVSGFAFGTDPRTGQRLRFENGPFRGKRVLVLTTLGDRPQAIGPRGKSGELCELLFGLLHRTFAYTGMDVLSPMAVPSADCIDDESCARATDALRDRLDHLFETPPLRCRAQFQGDCTEEWELVPEVRSGETGLSVHMVDPHESRCWSLSSGCVRGQAETRRPDGCRHPGEGSVGDGGTWLIRRLLMAGRPRGRRPCRCAAAG